MMPTSLKAEEAAPSCPEVLALCDRTLGYCEESEAKTQERLDHSEKMIGTLIKQRNEAVSDAISNSSPDVLDIVTYVVLGVAGGVILTRGIR